MALGFRVDKLVEEDGPEVLVRRWTGSRRSGQMRQLIRQVQNGTDRLTVMPVGSSIRRDARVDRNARAAQQKRALCALLDPVREQLAPLAYRILDGRPGIVIVGDRRDRNAHHGGWGADGCLG